MSAVARRAFLLCGPSLSGKSTAAEALRAALGATVISADRIQAERGVPFGAEGLPESVWAETLETALALLRQRARDGRHIVLDDTLCYRWLRDRIRQECRTAGLATALLLFRPSPDEILRRHAALLRDGSRPVLSRERLLAHLRDFEWPTPDEEAVDLTAEPALRAYCRDWAAGTRMPVSRALARSFETATGRARGERRVTMLDAIGGTRLVPLQRIVPEGSARILVKLECENPTGSMKDRMALAMVEAAEADGRLRPGGSLVEYTGGSTGVSLAFVCAVKRIPLQIVTSEAFSKEKRDHMAALGARLTLVPSPTGGTTKALTLEMIETARRLASTPGSCWTDQLNNTDQLASYERMGEEIWEQSGGQVGAFVHSVGTGGSLRGISTRLRGHDPAVQVVAVEPAESAVLSGGPSGSHRIEGTGAGFVVPLWNASLVDEIQTVSTEEAMTTARRLAQLEGLFAGTSTGGNVAVALRVAERLGPGRTVVTVAADSGMKYLSTALYAQATVGSAGADHR